MPTICSTIMYNAAKVIFFQNCIKRCTFFLMCQIVTIINDFSLKNAHCNLLMLILKFIFPQNKSLKSRM